MMLGANTLIRCLGWPLCIYCCWCWLESCTLHTIAPLLLLRLLLAQRLWLQVCWPLASHAFFFHPFCILLLLHPQPFKRLTRFMSTSTLRATWVMPRGRRCLRASRRHGSGRGSGSTAILVILHTLVAVSHVGGGGWSRAGGGTVLVVLLWRLASLQLVAQGHRAVLFNAAALWLQIGQLCCEGGSRGGGQRCCSVRNARTQCRRVCSSCGAAGAHIQ